LLTLGLLAACGLTSVGTAPDFSNGGAEAGVDVPVVVDDSAVGGDEDADAEVTEAEDATTLADAGIPDVAVDVVEAGSDGGCQPGTYRCGTVGPCVTSCLGCAVGRFDCEESRACVTACAGQCASAFECVTCQTDRVTLRARRCRPSPTAGCYGGMNTRCEDCKNRGCFGTEQTCFKLPKNSGAIGDRECRGCGEPLTDNQSCAGGGVCDDGTFACN
jgi:hypothetical protein